MKKTGKSKFTFKYKGYTYEVTAQSKKEAAELFNIWVKHPVAVIWIKRIK
jgi:hypothetical protein